MAWVKVNDSAPAELTDALVALIDQVLEPLTEAANPAPLPRSWHELQVFGGRSPLPDLTGGRWPRMCNDRRNFPDVTIAGVVYQLGVWCTRVAGHTGRHAAGRVHRVVAVWEDPEPAPDQWGDVGYLVELMTLTPSALAARLAGRRLEGVSTS